MGDYIDPFDTTGENPVVQGLVKWFLERFEPPDESMPMEGGVPQYIWGGPFDAREQLSQEFGRSFDEDDVERAATILETEWPDWAPSDRHPLRA